MEPARPRWGPTRPLTVAELVTLYGGPPGEPVGAAGPPVSVGALLRREGRAPHALDRPTVPRRHSRPPEQPAAPPAHSGRRTTAATGAVLMVGAVLGTAVVDEAVVAQPHLAPDTAAGTPVAGAAVAAGGPARAAHGSARTVSYLAPLTTAVPAGSDLHVASGASIGRDVLGGAPAGTPAAAAIPQPRTPVESRPPAAPVVVVPSPRLPPVPVVNPTGAVSPATVVRIGPAAVVAPVVAVSHTPVGGALPAVSVSPTTITTPDLTLGQAHVPLPDVALPAVDVPSVPLPVATPVAAVTGLVGGLAGR